jgi:hypothetical protein
MRLRTLVVAILLAVPLAASTASADPPACVRGPRGVLVCEPVDITGVVPRPVQLFLRRHEPAPSPTDLRTSFVHRVRASVRRAPF